MLIFNVVSLAYVLVPRFKTGAGDEAEESLCEPSLLTFLHTGEVLGCLPQ